MSSSFRDQNAAGVDDGEGNARPVTPVGVAQREEREDSVDISVIGTGNVGRTLGRRWAELGHAVRFGVRDPGAARHDDTLAASPGATTVGVAEAGRADVVVVAVPWAAAEAVARQLALGEATILVDAVNPLLPGLAGLDPAAAPSVTAHLATRTGSSRVVKAFNTTGAGNMADPGYGAARPVMPVAGDDAEAKATVLELADALGFDGLDAGGLGAAQDLEHLALAWIRLAYQLGNGPNIAWSLLRR